MKNVGHVDKNWQIIEMTGPWWKYFKMTDAAKISFMARNYVLCTSMLYWLFELFFMQNASISTLHTNGVQGVLTSGFPTYLITFSCFRVFFSAKHSLLLIKISTCFPVVIDQTRPLYNICLWHVHMQRFVLIGTFKNHFTTI